MRLYKLNSTLCWERIRRLTIKPENLWNYGEKGIYIEVMQGSRKAIVRAGVRQPQSVSKDNRKFVTVMETVGAAGAVIAPIIIWSCIAEYWHCRVKVT